MLNQDNTITVCGMLEAKPIHAYTAFKEPFYTGVLLVQRLSGAVDRLPVTIPGKIMASLPDDILRPITINGQVRSYNKADANGVNRLEIVVFANEVKVAGTDDAAKNKVKIVGTICRPPVHRPTPLGREICDLMLAVNRAFGKSDYIPCIAWGRDAQYAAHFPVGQRMEISGRLQSREYVKPLDDGTTITRTVYEVSAFTVAPAADAIDDIGEEARGA